MTSKFVSRLYLNSFAKQLARVSPRNGQQVAQYVQDRVPQTVENDRSTIKEMENQTVNLTMCASVLHAVEALEKFGNLDEKKGDPKPQVIVAQAMGKIPVAEFYMKTYFPKALGWMGKTAQQQTKNLIHPKLTAWSKRHLFNDFIDLRTTRSPTHDETNDSDAFVVKKCGYNEYFQRHGRPDAATAICLADSFWMDSMNASPACLNSCRRPSTISTGGKECRFEFVPKGQQQQEPIISDDVVKKALQVDSAKEDHK